MRPRLLSIISLSATTLACGGGPPGPPALGHERDAPLTLSYDVADTAVVSVALMGQRMEISQRGTSRYGVLLEPASGAVRVTVTVDALEGSIRQPMGAPIGLDAKDVDGPIVFTLDRVGDATVSRLPALSDEVSQMVSGLAIAHTFFPGLPARPVRMGDVWVDSVRFEGEEGPGLRREASVIEYRVEGDTTVAERSLLRISLSGTTEVENDLEVAGMVVSQASELEVRGHVLWDRQRGVMYESVKTARGSGTVSLPISPQALPIEISASRRARLRE